VSQVVSQSKKASPPTKLFVAALVTLLALPAPVAWAADDVEELKREVRELRAQIQALRTAILETAEMDRQRASILTKALKNMQVSSDAPASSSKGETASASRPEPPPPAAKTTARAEAPAPAPVVARRSAPPAPPPEAAPGTIRGKVAVPGGEPVAYVYVENILAPAVKERKTIEQVGKKFVPTWAVVQRGTTISFPNKDNIYHNVFSLSSGNSFDLGLYSAGTEAKTHTFLEPGAVDIYCNIHPQMAASTLVVPNRHYAKVKSDGSFELAGVPSGRRKVVAWAPGSRLTAEWVEVAGGATAEVKLKLEPKSPGHKNKSGQSYGSYE
jgi:plastocyanin